MRKKKFNFWVFLRAGLRRLWLKYPERYQCLVNARIKRGQYKCFKCEKIFKMRELHVHHIVPVGELTKWEHIEPFCRRLFCEAKLLQALCKECHKGEK